MKYLTPLFDAPADQGAAAPAVPSGAPVSGASVSGDGAVGEPAAPKASAPRTPRPVEVNDYGTPVPLGKRTVRSQPTSGQAGSGQTANGTASAAGTATPAPAVGEQVATTEQPRDAEGKYAAKEEAPEAAASETAPEPSPEPEVAEPEAAEPEAAEPAYDVLAEVRRAAPGLGLSSVEDLPEIVGELQEAVAGYRPIESAFEKSPAIADLIRSLNEGKAPLVALKAAYPDLVRDIEEGDPEYADYRAEQARQEERARFTKEQNKAREDLQARWQRDSQSTYQEFATRAPEQYEGVYSEEDFQADYQSLFSAEHARRFRGDHFDIVFKGLYHDRLEARAVEAARADERQKVLAEVRAGKVAPGAPAQTTPAQTAQPAAQTDELPPVVTGSGAQTGLDPNSLSPDEHRAYRFGQALLPGTRTNDYGTPVPLTRRVLN